jgi:hypothetical protein
LSGLKLKVDGANRVVEPTHAARPIETTAVVQQVRSVVYRASR